MAPRWLRKDDQVVCAFAQHASGPGWSNSPVLVVLRSASDGSHRVEYLQPAEQSEEVQILYAVSSAANKAMTSAVERLLFKKGGT